LYDINNTYLSRLKDVIGIVCNKVHHNLTLLILQYLIQKSRKKHIHNRTKFQEEIKTAIENVNLTLLQGTNVLQQRQTKWPSTSFIYPFYHYIIEFL